MSKLQKICIRSTFIVLLVTFPLWAIAIFAYFHPAKSSVISPIPDGRVIIPLRELPVKECHHSDFSVEYIYADENRYFSNNPCEDFIYHSPSKKIYKGKASYYSRAGCLGCSKDMIMANGEPLDDSKLTVAFNDAPLDSFATVINVGTKKSVRVKVTDTGGFKRHGKIVDLTMATRDAIGCGPVCDVEVLHD